MVGSARAAGNCVEHHETRVPSHLSAGLGVCTQRSVFPQQKLQQQLGDYPLAPYVEYHRLNNSIRQTSPSQIDNFTERHGNIPATKLLYSRWLIDQGKRRNWQTLIERRYDTSNPELECYFVRAQYGIGEKSKALDATTALWSKPKSQPRPVTRSFQYGAAPSVSLRTLFGGAFAMPWKPMSACLRVTCSGT